MMTLPESLKRFRKEFRITQKQAAQSADIAERLFGIAFVRLDEQDIGFYLAAQGGIRQHHRRDALDLIGALAVPRDGFAVLCQDMGDHFNSGGLAVAAGDRDDVTGQLNALQDIRAELQGDLSGHAAALADQLADKAQDLADENGKEFFHMIFLGDRAIDDRPYVFAGCPSPT